MSRLSRKHQAAIKKAADGQGVKTHSSRPRARGAGTPVDPDPHGRRKKTASQSPSDRSSQSGLPRHALARLPRPGKTGGDEDPLLGGEVVHLVSPPDERRRMGKAAQAGAWHHGTRKAPKRSTFSGVITPRRVRRPMRRIAKVRAKAAASTVDKRREELDLRRRRAKGKFSGILVRRAHAATSSQREYSAADGLSPELAQGFAKLVTRDCTKMRFLGGKHRISKYIAPLVLSRNRVGIIVDPFVGLHMTTRLLSMTRLSTY